MNLVFDIETNGLKPSKIHCIVAIDDQDKVYTFTPGQLEKGVEFLTKADTLIGHNIIGYDLPVIKKLMGVDLTKHVKIFDTLIVSRLINPNKEGGHSLEMWGYRLKFHKSEQPDFLNYSKEMLKYCIKDVQLNKRVYEEIQKNMVGFKKDSIELEFKVAEILKDQETTGFKFNMKKAILLLSKLRERMKEVEDEVHKVFQPKWVDEKLVTPKLKKDGTLSKSGLTDYEYAEIKKITNNMKPFMRQSLQEFNLGSRKQIGEYLQDFGWKPKTFTPTGQPIVDEAVLSRIKNIPEAKLIAEFLLLQKRIAQIESWIDAVEEDERVHGFVISTGAITGRMSHRKPNMAQVPSVHSPYGEECRACWIVSKGYKLIGVDAAQLELRMLAHYMKDEEYINEIINGDIHTANQKAAGLESRDQSKTFIYALIYNAGDERLGNVVGRSRADGKRLRQQFLDNTPTFKHLKDKVQRASKRGYVKGLDGRKIFIRHPHASLNTLLQGAGAILMKQALVILNNELKLQTHDVKFVANVHDEWQIEACENIADNIGKLAVNSIIKAGEHFNLRCPMDGEYKIGSNWSETH
jgi:DNA polymerase-1